MANITNNSSFNSTQNSIDQSSLKCIQINLGRGFDAHEELVSLINQESIDLVFISEPYLGKNKFIKNISNYSIHQFQSNNSTIKSAIIIKKAVFSTLSISSHSDSNIAIVQIRDSNNRKVYLISLYVEPRIDPLGTLDKLKQFVETNPFSDFVICGDFNAWHTMWNCHKNNHRGEKISQFITDNNLIVCNQGNSPTFSSTNANTQITRESIIDITLCSNTSRLSISDWRVDPELITRSDHFAISFGIRFTSFTPTKNIKLSTWMFNTSNKKMWESRKQPFRQEINKHINEEIDISNMDKEDINKYIIELTLIIQNTCRKVLPRPTKSRPRPVWWSEHLDDMKKQVIINHRKLSKAAKKKLPLIELLAEKHVLKTDYAKAIQEASNQSFKQFCNKQNKENVWSVTNRIIKTKPLSHPPATLILPDGSCTKDPTETSRLLIESLFPEDTFDNDVHKNIRNSTVNYHNTSNEPHFTKEEILAALQNMSPAKAPGHDGLTSDICLYFTQLYPLIIMKLLNRCLEISYFPKFWKLAVAKIIPKPGKDSYDRLESFRPIGLIPVFGKLLEKLMTQRLTHFMYSKELMTSNQFGFRQQTSTVDALHNAIDIVRAAKRDGLQVVTVSLDIKAAFDNAWWPAILHRLKRMNCPYNLYQMFANYFTEREVQIRFADNRQTKSMSRGCVQGSVCGPVLWNLIVDELLCAPLPEGTYLQAFADDILLISTSKTPADLENKTNTLLANIHNWGYKNKLTFSPAKTYACGFTNKATKIKLMFNNSQIMFHNSFKYLGIIIDRKLKFNNHVTSIIDKVKKIFNKLQIFVRATWGVHPENIKTLYLQVIEPIILYGSSVWSSALQLKYIRKKLLSLQRSFCINIIRAFKTINTPSSILLSGLLPLPNKIAGRAELEFARRNRVTSLLPNDITLETPAHPSNLLHPSFRRPITFSSAASQEELDSLVGQRLLYKIYTDGSKQEDGSTGAAVIVHPPYGRPIKFTHKLHDACSVFQAEQLAIARACEWADQSNCLETMVISDSLSSLLELGNPNSYNIHAVRTFHNIYNIFARGGTVEFVWSKAHVGIAGNEEADAAAKSACRSHKLPSHAQFPISFLKKHINSKFFQISSAYYSKHGTCNYTKKLFPTFSELSSFISNIPPDFQVTQFLTGHGYNRAYLHRFRISPTDKCPCDNISVQTNDHLYLECPRFASTRQNLLLICNIRNIDINNLLKISNSAELGKLFLDHIYYIVNNLKSFNK
jgi:ribonuclease HI